MTPRARRSLAPLLPLLALLLGSALLAAAPPAAALGTTAPVAVAVPGVDQVPIGVWPLDPVPEVHATFDPPDTPYGRGHRGVDLLGRVGQPVRAALPGTITYAGPLAGRGVLVVDHGPTRTTYQPVSASVAVGDEVAAVEVIGTLAAGGSHCAPAACLHWGWIEDETYLDPLLLVGGGPVRLLPLAGLGGLGGLTGLADPGVGWQPPSAWWQDARAQALGWAWR